MIIEWIDSEKWIFSWKMIFRVLILNIFFIIQEEWIKTIY